MIGRAGAALPALALCGCGSPEAPLAGPQPLDSVQVALSVAPPPRGSASAASVEARALFPRTTDSLADKLAYLGGFCSPLAKLVAPDGSQAAACDCCPNYGETCTPSDASAAILESQDSVLTVDQVFRGSFRKSGADEVAVIVSGCASAAENGGGTWLANVVGGRLEDLEYRAGDHPEGCTLLPKQRGLDRLLCSFSHGRALSSTHVIVVNYGARDQSMSGRELIEVTSNLSQVCGRGPGPIVDNRIESTRVADLDGDGLADVELVVSARRGEATAKDMKACDEGEYKGDLERLVRSRKKLVLRFLAGAGLKPEPDAETARLIEKL